MENNQKQFRHTADKNEIPVCTIMGVKIAAINMRWLLEYTKKNIKKLSGDYMCVSNVHTTVTAYFDPTYLKIQNEAIMAIPDGGPLSTLGRKRGYPKMERVTGPSYMEEVLSLSAQYGFRHYFYGSTEETLEEMKAEIAQIYPNVQIVGMYSPPFRELSKEEDQKIMDEINAAEPDFLWIGLGAPKQEKWMAAHQGMVRGFMVGVGAGFDYIAGNISRAPEWMQRHNLEWLYRLMQDPKRLIKRYLYTNTMFIWHAFIRGK